MRQIALLAALVAAVSLAAGRAAENAVQHPTLGVFRTSTYQVMPEIDSALLVTDEQWVLIDAAAKETVMTPDLVALRKKVNDQALPRPDRQAALKQFMKLWGKARNSFDQRLQQIFTPEQKALVPKLETAVSDAKKQFAKEHEAELKAFTSARVDQMLTPQQKEALAKAKPQPPAQ